MRALEVLLVGAVIAVASVPFFAWIWGSWEFGALAALCSVIPPMLLRHA